MSKAVVTRGVAEFTRGPGPWPTDKCPRCGGRTKRLESAAIEQLAGLYRCLRDGTGDSGREDRCNAFFGEVKAENGWTVLLIADGKFGLAESFGSAIELLEEKATDWLANLPKFVARWEADQKQIAERMLPIEFASVLACTNKACPAFLLALEPFIKKCGRCGGQVNRKKPSGIRTSATAETKRARK